MHLVRVTRGLPMKERELRRLFTRILTVSSPLSLALLGACGAATGTDEGFGGAGAGGTTTQGGSSNGGTSSAGKGGSSTGGGTAGSGGGQTCQGTMVGDAAPCAPYNVSVPSSCIPQGSMVGAALPAMTCQQVCAPQPIISSSCTLSANSSPQATVNCMALCAVGRRPDGFDCGRAELAQRGDYFAAMSRLEAASVDAFRILRDELAAFRAPRRLVNAAGRAARDEIRHARSTRALARRTGARAERPVISRRERRSLEAVALDNAVEGCVRETFGALLATTQAAAAKDPVVRAAMQRISRDETRHAALSWQVHGFLMRRLSLAARERIVQAQREAARELVASAEAEVPSFASVVGLPDRATTRELSERMARALWGFG